MKHIIALIILVISFKDTVAQNNEVVTTIDFSEIDPATKKLPALDAVKFPDELEEKFSEKTDDKIIIIVKNVPTGKLTLNGADIIKDGGDEYFDITGAIRAGITSPSALSKKFTFLLKVGTAAPIDLGSITVTWSKFTKGEKSAEILAQGKKNRDAIIDGFKRSASFEDPYNNKKDKVDLYFDENGKLLNFLPVNMDQNDVFIMHIVCEKGDEQKYRVKITEGEYSPSDLAIRPFTKIATASGSNKKTEVPKEYTVTTLHCGPYTSDNFKFQIAYDSMGTEKSGLLYSVKINKLFHVGVGVSIVRSNLEAPEYKTYFNGDDTTIQSFNGGSRTLFTFNVIWYWTIFHQKKEGAVIPNGRDVLKDEPSFSLARLFPTVGVTIDDKFKENFFLGVVYEFARGGSFTAGMHYGRVDRLKDKDFELGKTPFSGTDADIKLDKVYKPGFYIGLNVDTRILNLLFSKGQ